jgi:hypothetical protein
MKDPFQRLSTTATVQTEAEATRTLSVVRRSPSIRRVQQQTARLGQNQQRRLLPIFRSCPQPAARACPYAHGHALPIIGSDDSFRLSAGAQRASASATMRSSRSGSARAAARYRIRPRAATPAGRAGASASGAKRSSQRRDCIGRQAVTSAGQAAVGGPADRSHAR